MKVDATLVAEFLNQVKALAEDINYTIRCGDDGFEETVNDQVANIGKAIELFKLQVLTPLTPVEPVNKVYSRLYDKYADTPPTGHNEGLQLYKAQFYFTLKRLIKNDTGISEVPNDQLQNYIEYLIPESSKYKLMIDSNEFFHSSMMVLREVTEEVIEQRKKAPQAKLF